MDAQGEEKENASKPPNLEDATVKIKKEDNAVPIEWARGSIDVAEDGRLAFTESQAATQPKSNIPQDFPCADEMFDQVHVPAFHAGDGEIDVSLWSSRA